jgi:hypothetical protein
MYNDTLLKTMVTTKGGFQVSIIRRRVLKNRKRRIGNRLREMHWEEQPNPMFTASNIHYEVAERTKAIDAGGVGLAHKLAREVGLIDEIDQRVKVLKRHLPYHESDHILNSAYNFLAGGTCLDDLELLRNDEAFLDALGAQRIPDPTTAGDFCRRFDLGNIEALMGAINNIRLRVWSLQNEAFFSEALIDVDGTLTPTTGGCKEGMDISYKGVWGYHPLLVSLRNTGEPLFIVNRSGNRPSYEGAPERLDQAIDLCRRGSFRKITIRGDTDFSQTEHLDRWDDDGVRFIFGIDAMPNLKNCAQNLPEKAWSRLHRAAKYKVKTDPRQRPENVKERIVRERKFKNIRLRCEDVAEFQYSPTKCTKTYRVVVVRKNLTVEKGENALFDHIRFFFYITNDRRTSPAKIVFLANDRCHQENLIEQLKNGVRALHAPLDNLFSNWAYMVMASLAWSFKSWFALSLPAEGRWKKRHAAEKETVLKMEFKRFLNTFMRVPAQISRQGRKIIYRFLSWNPLLPVFFRLADRLAGGLRW